MVEYLSGIAAQHVEASHHSGIQKHVHLSMLDVREGRFLRQLLRQEDGRGCSDIRRNGDSRLNGKVHAELQTSKLQTMARVPAFGSVDKIGSPARPQRDPRIRALAGQEVIRALDASRGGPVVARVARQITR